MCRFMDIFSVTVKKLRRKDNSETWVTADRMLLIVMNNVFFWCVRRGTHRLAAACLAWLDDELLFDKWLDDEWPADHGLIGGLPAPSPAELAT